MRTLEAEIERLLAHPRFDRAVHRLAQGFLAVQAVAPRLASQFATQQRWLMSHAALSLYFRGLEAGRSGLSRKDFVEEAFARRLASRNTTAAFFAEAQHYGLTRPIKADSDLVEPAPSTLSVLVEWYAIHLGALDMLDDGARAQRLREADDAFLAALEPATADALLSCDAIRSPPPSYAVFASVDEGGSLMDRLVIGVDVAVPRDRERAATDVTSISALARPFNLSRTHAGRILAAAMATGSIGWSGVRGHSPIWLSRDFRADYARFQAVKLAIIAAAFEGAERSTGPDLASAVAAATAVPGLSGPPAC